MSVKNQYHWLSSKDIEMNRGKKILVLIAVLCSSIGFTMMMSNASAFPFGQISGPGATLLSLDKGHFSVRYVTPEIQSVERAEKGIRFTQLQLGDLSIHGEEGAPGIPHFGLFFAIPTDADVQVDVDLGPSKRFEDIRLMPVQPPVPDTIGAPTPPFAYDAAAYKQGDLLPYSQYFLEEEKRLRGLRVNHLWISPIRYDSINGTLEVFDQIDVTVTFIGGRDRFFADPAYRSKNFDSLYRKLLVNGTAIENISENETKSSGKESAPSFLILSHPNFLESANELRDWKMQKGILTEVIDATSLGESGEAIFEFIQDTYVSEQPPVENVLIIGDAEFVPTMYRSFHFAHFSMMGSDHHYACVDGNDYLPDIGIGRIAVDTPEQALDRIQKIIRYESNPIKDADFYNTSWHFAYFQDDDKNGKADRRFALTSEEMYQWFTRFAPDPAPVPNRCFTTDAKVNPAKWSSLGSYRFFADWWDLPTDSIPAELTREAGYPWDCDNEDITQAVNEGTFFLTHRDHGATQRWGDPAYSTGNVAALTNNDKLPVVFSVNCQTGWFDNETDSILAFSPKKEISFAESWMRNFNGGAVGVLAATRISYSGYNDRLVWGWMDALWPGYIPQYPDVQKDEERIPTMSEVLNYGKVYLSSVYNASDTRKIAIEEFIWFGDPTMKMWTREPIDFDVSHPESLTYSADALPIEIDSDGATVVMMIDGQVIDIQQSAQGKVEFPIDFPTRESLTINLTITKDNHRPYFGTVKLVNCVTDEDCSDDVFCNGSEVCVNDECLAGDLPGCDDDLYCTGTETCDTKLDMCISSGNPCSKGTKCSEEISACESSDPYDEDTTGDVCGF